MSGEGKRGSRGRAGRIRALAYLLAVGTIAGVVGWINHSYIGGEWRWYMTDRPFLTKNIWPYVLKPAAEQALKPGQSFTECSTPPSGGVLRQLEQEEDYCPEMVVVPAGSFVMGSPADEKGHRSVEGPQHKVAIEKPFAVSRYEAAFDEWDTCVTYGDCAKGVSDSYFGRGRQPAINVTWNDVRRYVAWLSKATGKPYRLLTEAEYEYAARAGTQTAYPWGDAIGKNDANCDGCGSKWDNGGPAPAGSFAANGFGLYDMVGNVWEWVEDCGHANYNGAPTDGSAWVRGGDCNSRVVRGGSWSNGPEYVRSAVRRTFTTHERNDGLGFRVGRTLDTR